MQFIKNHIAAIGLIILLTGGYFLFGHELQRSNFGFLISLYTGLFILSWLLIKNYGINFWLLAGLGIFFRLLFFPVIPNLSQDFYRFLWDGRLLVDGINPYLFTPEQLLNNTPPKSILSNWTIDSWNAITVVQGQELYNGMGALNGSHYSNYPPINQLCFAIASFFTGKSILGSAMVLRLLIILADIGILYFGRKLLIRLQLPVENIFWYFLNPFIIIEMTGNLHFESVMLFFVVWALYLLHRGNWVVAAILWGLSISLKLLPLLLLPLFFMYFSKRDNANRFLTPLGIKQMLLFYSVTLATVALTFAPFLSNAFVSNFGESIGLWFQKFEFNASIYYIIRWIGFQTIGWNIIADVGKILPLFVVFILLLFTFFRKNKSTQQLITSMLFGISVYFLLSTTVHPWYIATPLVLSVFTKYKFPIVWSAMVMLSYSAYTPPVFGEELWLIAIEYLVVLGVFLYEVFWIKNDRLQPAEHR